MMKVHHSTELIRLCYRRDPDQIVEMVEMVEMVVAHLRFEVCKARASTQATRTQRLHQQMGETYESSSFALNILMCRKTLDDAAEAVLSRSFKIIQ